MTRRRFLALPAIDLQVCELEAVGKWNKFAKTSQRYLELRQTGVRNAKERKRMEEQFADVMKTECF